MAVGLVDVCREVGPTVSLSRRQGVVVALLARGRSYQDVAFQLGIAVGTVGAHATRAYRRLGVDNIRAAAQVSKHPNRKRGALPPPLFPT